MFLTIKLYLHLNCILMLNWIVWNRTIFIKMDLALNNRQRLIYHKTQTTKTTNTQKRRIPHSSEYYLSIFYRYIIYLCFSIIWFGVGPELSTTTLFFLFLFFFNLVLKRVYLYSSEKSVRYSFFLFDELCKQNLYFPSLLIWSFKSPPMIRTLCLGMFRTREDNSL